MFTIPPIPALLGGFNEGIAVSNILFGVMIAQFYKYSQNWEGDPMWLKCLAAGLVLAETVNTVFAQRLQYMCTVLAIGHPLGLIKIDWAVPVMIAFQLTSEVLVQCFYMHRMWMISKNRLLTAGMIILFVARTGLLINCIVDTMKFETWLQLVVDPDFRPSTLASAAITAASDIVVAVTIVYSLRKEKVQFRRTKGVINWLVLYFVNSSAVLVAICIAVFVSIVLSPNTLLFVGLYVVYTKLLANSLFGALNARQNLRSELGQITTFGDILTDSNTPRVSECIRARNPSVRVGANTTTGISMPKRIDTQNSFESSLIC